MRTKRLTWHPTRLKYPDVLSLDGQWRECWSKPMTIRAVIIGIIVFVVAVVGLILIFPVGNEQQNRQPSPHALDQSN
jgi:hypothetical protein